MKSNEKIEKSMGLPADVELCARVATGHSLRPSWRDAVGATTVRPAGRLPWFNPPPGGGETEPPQETATSAAPHGVPVSCPGPARSPGGPPSSPPGGGLL